MVTLRCARWLAQLPYVISLRTVSESGTEARWQSANFRDLAMHSQAEDTESLPVRAGRTERRTGVKIRPSEQQQERKMKR